MLPNADGAMRHTSSAALRRTSSASPSRRAVHADAADGGRRASLGGGTGGGTGGGSSSAGGDSGMSVGGLADGIALCHHAMHGAAMHGAISKATRHLTIKPPLPDDAAGVLRKKRPMPPSRFELDMESCHRGPTQMASAPPDPRVEGGAKLRAALAQGHWHAWDGDTRIAWHGRLADAEARHSSASGNSMSAACSAPALQTTPLIRGASFG